MSLTYIVADDFYENPYDIRDYALILEYRKNGLVPGKRSILSIITEEQKIKIENIMYPFTGKKIINFEPDYNNGTFMYSTVDDNGWIHVDLNYRKWIAIVYLTPNAPIEGGTSLYLHKSTKKQYVEKYEDNLGRIIGSDLYNWYVADDIGNKFNRIFIFKSNYYHSISNYFGKTISDGRLVQTFFFDIE
jgi:hypothetical protein